MDGVTKYWYISDGEEVSTRAELRGFFVFRTVQKLTRTFVNFCRSFVCLAGLSLFFKSNEISTNAANPCICNT
jgi:hypothetical protein